MKNFNIQEFVFSFWTLKLRFASLLENSTPKIVAKAMWLLGEMGLLNPQAIAAYTANIAQFITSENDLLRERVANALGRIGRADYELVSPYMGSLLSLSDDKNSKVRLSFIWASENIATNTPTAYENELPLFEKPLDDDNERVRMEARAQNWINKNIERYRVFGFGLWAVCLKITGEMIGAI